MTLSNWSPSASWSNEAMARDVPAPVACHNDLLAENFILGDDGRMWVIDWEYGGINDPYYDLGVLCAENPLTEDEERAVISRYCGEMDVHRYARMMLYKIISDLWWSLWAMLQARFSRIEFDYFQLRDGASGPPQGERRAPRLPRLAGSGLIQARRAWEHSWSGSPDTSTVGVPAYEPMG